MNRAIRRAGVGSQAERGSTQAPPVARSRVRDSRPSFHSSLTQESEPSELFWGSFFASGIAFGVRGAQRLEISGLTRPTASRAVELSCKVKNNNPKPLCQASGDAHVTRSAVILRAFKDQPDGQLSGNICKICLAKDQLAFHARFEHEWYRTDIVDSATN